MTNPLIEKWNEKIEQKNKKKFTHIDVELPNLKRETIDGIRYYVIPPKDEEGEKELRKFFSVTSVTSHFNKEKFIEWRERVGDEKANLVTKFATARGTAMHTLAEHYLSNTNRPIVAPLPQLLFDVARPALDKIDNIHALEKSMYSEYFSIAGTVDCIAEYGGELSVIDFKSSEKPKPRKWIENYFVQAAAYAFMYAELTGKRINQIVIIMACENGELEVYIEKDLKKYISLLVQYVEKFTLDKLKEYEQLKRA
jgi:genome maintenance exonuclease 1